MIIKSIKNILFNQIKAEIVHFSGSYEYILMGYFKSLLTSHILTIFKVFDLKQVSIEHLYVLIYRYIHKNARLRHVFTSNERIPGQVFSIT